MAQADAALVDFRKLKDRVPLKDIVGRYEIELRPEGQSLVGACPLCGGSSRTRKFRVTSSKNAWKCWDCKEGGNQIDLVAALEKISIKEAARLIAEWFGIEDCYLERKPKPKGKSKRPQRKQAASLPTKTTREAATPADYDTMEETDDDSNIRHNPPLSWPGLQNLEAEHDAVVESGLMPDTVAQFESGMCNAGMMKDHLAISLHNGGGDLLGYCGVALDGRADRLKWPPADKYEPGLELYNMHRACASAQYEDNGLIIVEDFLDVFRLYEAGFDNAVALMGEEITEQQLLKLRLTLRSLDNPSTYLTVFAQPSKSIAGGVVELSRFAWVRLVTPKEGKHPRELSPSMIEELLK